MSKKNASGIIECLRLRGGGISRKRGESGREEKRGGNGIVLHQRGKVSNCRASKWEIWRNGISKCKLLFVRNYKRCILEQCAMWEKQISGSALETPMQIIFLKKYISVCKDYFWPPEASFLDQTGSGKWMEKAIFGEEKNNSTIGHDKISISKHCLRFNSNASFFCVRYSIGEIFYSSKCTYLPCWGSCVRIIMVSDDAEFKKLYYFVNLTCLTYNRVMEYSIK